MAIISYSFIVFAALLLFVYYTVGRKYQWIVLLMANTVFYLTGGWKSALYLLVTLLTVYAVSRKLEAYNAEQNAVIGERKPDTKTKKEIKKIFDKKKRIWLLLAAFINIGILCFVKYAAFLIENISGNRITLPFSVIVPLGISFYTFQAVGYVIDIYRGKTQAEKNIFKLALFISFFPVITQGPILRFDAVKEQLFSRHRMDYRTLTFGLQRMVWGFFKKLVIAERLSVVYKSILENYADHSYYGILVFIGVFLGGLHTYVDFSGGMDIIIGLSESLGIILPENFERPFMSRTYSEFWKRWHISLGAWFKNYVFYPISLSGLFRKLTQKSKARFGDTIGKVVAPSIASFITFFIIGIWHGANWKYVAYGIWQAFFVAQGTLLEPIYEKLRKYFHVNTERFSYRMFQIVRTVVLVTIGRYFSFAANLTDAWHLFGATLKKLNLYVLFDDTFYQLGLDEKNFRLMFASIILLWVVSVLQERGIEIRETIARQNIFLRWTIYLAGIFAVLIFGQYGPGYDAAGFVYQGF